MSPPVAQALVAPLELDDRLAWMVELTRDIRRSDGPEGCKPFLPRWHQRRLLDFFQRCDRSTKRDLLSLFDALSPERKVACGLLLRAIFARIDDFDRDEHPVDLLGGFVQRLVGGDDEALRRRATVLDLDSRESVNDFDILSLAERRGVIYEPRASRSFANNDGLFQRFTAACGPTVLQMMIAELDPLVAFRIHDSGLYSDAVNDPAGRFQRKLLEQYGGVAIGRREAQLRARVRNALGRLSRFTDISTASLDAFRAFTEDGGPATEETRSVLGALRERFDGFPSADDIRRLRHAAPMPEQDEGIDDDAFAHALKTHVTPLSGVRYRRIGNQRGIARGQTWRYLDRIVAALKQGIDVPIGIAEPSHWMLITCAKGRRPNRQLLVSDPEAGRTTWVHEKAFVQGRFLAEQFFVCAKGERGYVDCIFVDGP